jgi:hypothetical protein
MTAGGIALLILLVANIALFMWLGGVPVQSLGAASSTKRSALSIAIFASVLALFPAGVMGPAVLIPLAVVALAVLILMRHGVTRRQVAYAGFLGIVAAVGGTIAWLGSRNAGDLLFALFQLPLVVFALLAGWAIAQKMGWTALGIGLSRFISRGAAAAVRSFGFGIVLALPWAMGNIAGGLFAGDAYHRWWQPLAALQPGIAEEAWGRVFVIALLYLLYRRFAKARPAIIAAAVVGALWFAWLHAPLNPFATVVMAAIYVAPMALVWMRRDVETAIGFHFSADLVRFTGAYLAFHGLWFS